MKNILTGRMRKVLFIAVCIRSSLWGEICYSAETGRILSGSDTGKGVGQFRFTTEQKYNSYRGCYE